MSVPGAGRPGARRQAVGRGVARGLCDLGPRRVVAVPVRTVGPLADRRGDAPAGVAVVSGRLCAARRVAAAGERRTDRVLPGRRRGGGVLPGATQHGVDARTEFAWTEGLDDVLVGARAEPEHDVGLILEPGEHDDVGVALRADAARGFEPVDPRHVHVEGGDQRPIRHDRADAVDPVADGHRREPRRLEHLAEEMADVRVVLDDDGGLEVERWVGHRRSSGSGKGADQGRRQCKILPSGHATQCARGAARSGWLSEPRG